ncbi:MAG: hypothetical protein M1822_008000 [Bathelium mastoideum]|nr:MAG: hypothetical protein M1822_008000 [Bathelium mastoideum]
MREVGGMLGAIDALSLTESEVLDRGDRWDWWDQLGRLDLSDKHYYDLVVELHEQVLTKLSFIWQDLGPLRDALPIMPYELWEELWPCLNDASNKLSLAKSLNYYEELRRRFPQMDEALTGEQVDQRRIDANAELCMECRLALNCLERLEDLRQAWGPLNGIGLHGIRSTTRLSQIWGDFSMRYSLLRKRWKGQETPRVGANITTMQQWKVLGEVRSQFFEQWAQFRRIILPDVSGELWKSCKNWRRPDKLLRLGIITFQHLLERRKPSTAEEGFALTCLSYAMSNVIQARGHMIADPPGAKDFASLLLCLKSPKEQQTLYQALILTWPMNMAELTRIVGEGHPFACDRWRDIFTEPGSSMGSPCMPVLSLEAWLQQQTGSETPENILRSLVDRLMSVSSVDEGFSFSAFLDLDLTDGDSNPSHLERQSEQPTKGSSGLEDGVEFHIDYGPFTSIYATSIFIRIKNFMICEEEQHLLQDDSC